MLKFESSTVRAGVVAVLAGPGLGAGVRYHHAAHHRHGLAAPARVPRVHGHGDGLRTRGVRRDTWLGHVTWVDCRPVSTNLGWLRDMFLTSCWLADTCTWHMTT